MPEAKKAKSQQTTNPSSLYDGLKKNQSSLKLTPKVPDLYKPLIEEPKSKEPVRKSKSSLKLKVNAPDVSQAYGESTSKQKSKIPYDALKKTKISDPLKLKLNNEKVFE